jgi:type II secretory pathway pseudopilin PulG
MFEKGIFGLYRKQGGQALLIVVLVMVIALTVGLSIASRAITNLKVSEEQVNSQKALSAAEVGIDRVIADPGNADLQAGHIFDLHNNSKYSTQLSAVSGANSFLINGGYKVTKNNYTYIWTTPYSNTTPWQNPWSGSLTIYWGDSSNACSEAALELTVISRNDSDVANPILNRYAYDPCTPVRSSQNGFNADQVPGTLENAVDNINLYYSVPITLKEAYIVSVAPVYADSYIGAFGVPSGASANLPDQGSNITAVGSVNMTESNVQRVLSAFQGFPQIPAELFPFTIFSPN